MAKKKKVTRKQLLNKPDEFITLTGRLVQFGTAHKNQLIYGVAALLVLMVVITGVRWSNNRAENKASDALGRVLRSYAEVAAKQDAAATYQALADDLKAVVDNYGGSDAGKLARLILADLSFEAARYDDAVTYYKQALKDYDDQGWVKDLALNGLAYSYEAKGDDRVAAELYQQVLDDKGSIIEGQTLISRGRLLAAEGQRDQSLAAYKQFISEYPNSAYVDLAKEYVEQHS